MALTPIEIAVLGALREKEELTALEAGRLIHLHGDASCMECRGGSWCSSAEDDGRAALLDLESRWLARRSGRLWIPEDRLRPEADPMRPEGRDPARELLWLMRAEGAVDAYDARAFTHRALGRLDAAVISPLESLLDELEQAAADLGALGVLARQAVELADLASDAEREFIATTLHFSMAFGAYAYYSLTLARRHLQSPEDHGG